MLHLLQHGVLPVTPRGNTVQFVPTEGLQKVHITTMSTPTNDIVSQTIEERGKVYGDVALSHENIGLAWTGLIQQHFGIILPKHIPGFLVAQMMVAMKNHRAARVYHEDNYIDLAAYAKFAQDMQKPTPTT